MAKNSFEWGWLRTRVARRVVILFLICALLPILALAGISLFFVGRQLQQQEGVRIERATQSAAVATTDRLVYVDTEMRLLASQLASRAPLASRTSAGSPSTLSEGALETATEWQALQGAAVVTEADLAPRSIFGPVPEVRALTRAEKERLEAGGSLLLVGSDSGGRRIALARILDAAAPERGVVWVQADSAFLWTSAEQHVPLENDGELCVLDMYLNPLQCSYAPPKTALESGLEKQPAVVAWDREGAPFRGSVRRLFLDGLFGAPDWYFVVGQPARAGLGPLAGFQRSFIPITLLSLLVVLLISNVQIRRVLEPLATLSDGARRVGEQDFSTEVVVTTGDEFSDLAGAFNQMSGNLGRQFGLLSSLNEVDRAALSVPEATGLADPLLQAIEGLLPHRARAVVLLDDLGKTGVSNEGWMYGVSLVRGSELRSERVSLNPDDVKALDGDRWIEFNREKGRLPTYLETSPFDHQSLASWLIVPIRISGLSVGVIAFAHRARSGRYSMEACQNAAQVSDRIAVALTNVARRSQVERLSWGALHALARAIDASSPWTAGHSERVASVSVRLARELGLSEEDCELIRRAGYLHDIGKLGIDASILDKPGRLTDEELMEMQRHVTIGAKILEPIEEYADMLPMVLYHHERFDGLGYPEGRSGEGIPLHARIMALADTYDALTSDRPYRDGMTVDVALQIIRENSGTQFDPALAEAFLRMLERDRAALYEADPVAEGVA